jgi:hypothetical protein
MQDMSPAMMLDFIRANKNSYHTLVKKDEVLMEIVASVNGATLQERLYNYCHGLSDAPLCATCQTDRVSLKDKSFFRGYNKHCSIKCAAASDEKKAAFVQTCNARYGGGARKSPGAGRKYLETWNKNIVSNRASIERAKRSRAATCVARYGAENVLQVPSILERAHKACSRKMHSYRQHVSPCGIAYRVRGFEDRAIDLLEQTVGVGNFIADDFKTPRIKYTLNGRVSTYYPDIYIPGDNCIIEVKSSYWLKKQHEKNVQVMTEALKQGFNFQFWVCDDKSAPVIINTTSDLTRYLA